MAASAALAGLAAVAANQRFAPGESAVLEGANELPRWAGAPLEGIMALGTAPAFLVALVVVAVRAVARGRAALAVGLALLAAHELDGVGKELIERPRPTGLVEGLIVRDGAAGFAFPSGHTTMAAALAAVLHPLLPRWARRVAWTLAVAVGVARMHVGVHWPLDVLGGLALGVAIGAAAWLVAGADYRRPRS